MGNSYVSWGVPDYGDFAHRVRIVRLLRSAGAKLPILHAPTGWGKTLVAADYAASYRGNVLWIDCVGGCPAANEIYRELYIALCEREGGVQTSLVDNISLNDVLELRRRTRKAPSTDQILLVLDDVLLESRDGVEQLLQVHRALIRARVHMLATSRSELLQAELAVGGIQVIGVEQLAVQEHEAEAFALSVLGRMRDDCAEVAEACGGHPALFNLMVSQTEARNLAPSPHVRSSVAEWLERLAASCLSPNELADLVPVALLKRGSCKQLKDFVSSDPVDAVARLASAIPLVRLAAHDPENGDRSFCLHELAEEWVFSRTSWIDEQKRLSDTAVLLTESGDYRRAATIILRFAQHRTREIWLLKSGEVAAAAGAGDLVLRILDAQDIHSLMNHPPLLVLWGERLLENGDSSDALGKARAAFELASHSDMPGISIRAMHLWVEALQRLDRHSEGMQVAERLVELAKAHGESNEMGRALATVARVGCHLGDMERAHRAMDESLGYMMDGASVQDYSRAKMYAAVVRCLRTGDYSMAAGEISGALSGLTGPSSARVVARGNLANALLEVGRLSRAKPLARNAASEGTEYDSCAFGALSPLIASAAGERDEALSLVRDTCRLCIRVGGEYDLAVNRIALSVLLRAEGDNDDALSEAERAYERLSVMDYMGYRRLAALEVAASLVALGDVAAGRRWAENVMTSGFEGNAYHALRAAMILAECDRREGNLADGVTRLAAHRAHITSESSNWQMAMYIRAFPDLLGMLASATGADALPIHMLKMVLPEFGELGLRCAKAWMDPGEWKSLGLRVLGEGELARLERRQGEPICRVRLFGGLDVAVGDRMIGERDWKKRKARLLFAMLVAQRGQDLSRDQILEHLWPEMPDENARNNFYVAWSAMKSALVGRSGSCAYLENTGGRCRIVADAVRSDIDEFEEALAEAREAESRSDRSSALEAYSRLMTVYRGDLLPADIYDDWFSMLRDRYRLEFVDAMLRAAQILLEQDDPCEALVYSRRALGIDPLREDLYQATLRCHIAAGQRSGAIDTFLQCKMRLVEDLGLDPSAETMSLYQEILVMEDCPRYDDYGLS